MKLSFEQLQRKNLERCSGPEGFGHSLEAWRPSQWTNAMAGEVGEACNVTKKIDRHLDGLKGNLKPGDTSYESLRMKLMSELGDVVIYADLTAQRVGLSLRDCVAVAFNQKSTDIGSSVLLKHEGQVELTVDEMSRLLAVVRAGHAPNDRLDGVIQKLEQAREDLTLERVYRG